MLQRRPFSRFVGCCLLALSLAACGGSGAPAQKTEVRAASTPRGVAKRLEIDPRIGVYTSTPWGFSTASYWIEGPSGLIFIDTQFLLSAAEEAMDAAESLTGKKIALAIVLHPNPDKFNGTALFQARGIRVVTSAQVLAKIPAVHKMRKDAFYDRYKPDYPTDAAKPESFGETDQELSAAGLKVKARVLGPGCSAAHVVVEYEGHAFVGDLVGNGTHAWIEIGEIEQWIKRLAEIAEAKPTFVHPGRGKSAGPELLEWETAYLNRLLAEIATEKPTWPAAPGAIENVRSRMVKAYPALSFDAFLDVGLEEVFRKQAEKAARQ